MRQAYGSYCFILFNLKTQGLFFFNFIYLRSVRGENGTGTIALSVLSAQRPRDRPAPQYCFHLVYQTFNYHFSNILLCLHSELIEELSRFDEKQSENKNDEDISKRVKGYKKTSLNTSVHIFEEFLRKLEATWKGQRIKNSGKFQEKVTS